MLQHRSLSTIAAESTLHFWFASNERFRDQLVTEGILVAHEGTLVFTRDHLFSSPSMAAMALRGRSANGWVEWKTPQGRTLDEVKRQSVKIVD